jgi:hypothetical protein
VKPDASPGDEDPAAWARRRLSEARREQRSQLEGQRRRLLGHVRRSGGDLSGVGGLLAAVEAELAGLPPDDDEPGEVRPPATVSRVRLRRHGSQHANG